MEIKTTNSKRVEELKRSIEGLDPKEQFKKIKSWFIVPCRGWRYSGKIIFEDFILLIESKTIDPNIEGPNSENLTGALLEFLPSIGYTIQNVKFDIEKLITLGFNFNHKDKDGNTGMANFDFYQFTNDYYARPSFLKLIKLDLTSINNKEVSVYDQIKEKYTTKRADLCIQFKKKASVEFDEATKFQKESEPDFARWIKENDVDFQEITTMYQEKLEANKRNPAVLCGKTVNNVFRLSTNNNEQNISPS
jgi:hypothetical protein